MVDWSQEWADLPRRLHPRHSATTLRQQRGARCEQSAPVWQRSEPVSERRAILPAATAISAAGVSGAGLPPAELPATALSTAELPDESRLAGRLHASASATSSLWS